MWNPATHTLLDFIRKARLVQHSRELSKGIWIRICCLVLLISLLASAMTSAPQSVLSVAKSYHARVSSWLGANAVSSIDNLGLESIYRRYGLPSKGTASRVAPRRSDSPRESAGNGLMLPSFVVTDSPTNLIVTSTANNSIVLNWTAPAGAIDHYSIERSVNVSGFGPYATSTTASFNDSTVASGSAYLYRVRAVDGGGGSSLPSNMALGTAI